MHLEEKFVCINCFEEPGLVRFVNKNAVAKEFSFCPAKENVPIAASIEEVSEHFVKCLFREYDLSVNVLGWDGSEGGWVGAPSWDAYELAFDEIELGFPQGNEDLLLPYLFGENIDQDWCEENGYGLNNQQLARYSWEHFCKVVMHERRFFFLRNDGNPYEPDVYSPGEVLRTIFQYAQQMNLFKEMPDGVHLVRARWEGPKPHLETPEELGPPPSDRANQSNRMSPAGIPMFYGCDEEDTALKETASSSGYFAIGQFETLRPATVLDLTAIPPVPSLFDPMPDSTEVPPRRVLMFLHHVGREVSRPIERGDRVHVDYVPTQVVTEFVRDQLTRGNSRVDGIKYFSSVHEGHVSYVLFADQSNVHSTPESSRSEDHWLKLTGTKHRWKGSVFSKVLHLFARAIPELSRLYR